MAASKAIGFAVLLLGVVLFVVGIMMGPWLASDLDRRFKKAGEGSCEADDLTKRSFREPFSDCDDCTPLHYGFYPFHLSNAAEYLADPSNTKPLLEEKGPYFYRNYEFRVDPELEGDFVSYKVYSTWEFDTDMSVGAETDMMTKVDLGYLAVTTATGGERNFIDSLLQALLAMRGQEVDVALIPDVIKSNFMRLINGLNSFDPATMLLAVSELGPLFAPDTDVDAFMAQLAAKTFDGFFFNGVFVTRTVRQWFIGQPSFIAGLAIGSQFPSCAAPIEAAGGQSLLDICDTCSGAACHPYWSQCNTCRRARAIRASSDDLCDALEAQLTEALGAAQAAAVTGGTCRQCSSSSLFCLGFVPGEVGDPAPPEPVEESALKMYKVNQGCSDVTKNGEYEMYSSRTATATWQTLAAGQNMPSVFDLMRFSTQSWCDEDVAEGVECMGFVGNNARVFAPGGVKVGGMEDELAFGSQLVFVTQAMVNVTMTPTATEVKTKGLTLRRALVAPEVLHRVPWNEPAGIGFPVDGMACVAFQFGFLAFISRPMFLHADASLLDPVRLLTRNGVEVTADTAAADLTEDYETFVDVQPALGLTMDGRKRLMGSVALANEAVPGSDRSTANLVHPSMPANVVLPVYWVEERSTVTDRNADRLKDVVRLSEAMAPVCGVGVGLGLICWAIAAVILSQASRTSPDNAPAKAGSRDVETAVHPSAGSDSMAKQGVGSVAPPVQTAQTFPVQLAFYPPPAQFEAPMMTNVPLVHPGAQLAVA